MANHVDGSIIIDTELNPEGFKKGSDGLQKALKSLSSKMDSLGPTFDKALKGNARAIQTFEGKVKSLETSIGDLEKKMEELGESRVPTDDYKWLTAEIEKARKKLIDLEERQIKLEDTGVSKNSKAWKNLQYDIDLAKSKIQDYENEQASMRDSGTAFEIGADTAEYSQLEATLTTLKNRLAELRAGSAQTKTGIAGLLYTLRSAAPLSEQFKQALIGIPKIASQIRTSLKSAGVSIKYVFTHPIRSINQLLGSTRAGIRYLGKETLKHIGSTCKNAFKSASKSILSFRKHTNGATKSANKFGGSFNQIKRMLGQMLIFRAFTAVLTSAKDGLDNLSKYSTKTNSDLSAFKSSLTQLKNSFATAFAPILSVVTPILTTLINHLSTTVTYVGKLIAALTGAKSFTKATAVQEDYAASLDKTAKSAEETERQLMGFDKINKLDDKSSNSNSGNANVSDMFEEVPIESNITDFAEQLKTAIENSDYEGVGELLAEKLNSVVDKINKAINWENVEPKATTFVNGFTGTFNSLVDNVDWTLIGNTVGEGINTVVNTVHLLVTGIDWKDIGTAFSDGINGFISTVDWGNIGDTISDGVKGIIGTLRASIADMDWQNVGGAVSSALNNIDWVDIVSSVVGSVSDTLKGAFDLAIGFIKDLDWTKLGADLWNSLVAVITNIDWLGLVTKAFDLLGKVIKGAINLFTGIATAIVDSLKNAWSSISSLVQEFANGGGGDIIEGLKQGIIDALKSIGAWLYENIFLPIWEGIKSIFGINSPSTKMMEIGRFLIEGLLVGLGNIWNKVKEKFTELYDKIVLWFDNRKEKFKYQGSKILSGIKDGLGNLWNSIKEKFTALWTNLSSWFTNKVSSFKNLGSTLISNIKSGIGNIWTSLKSKFTTFWTDMKNWFAGRALKLKTTWDTTSTLGKALVNMGLKGMPKLSFFAKGGIVDGATLSVLGEAGKEAVIPLERNTGWMKVMAQAIAGEIASDSFGVQKIDISYDFDETLVSGIRSVSYEFLERLQAIASSVTFTMPVVTQQSVPYAVAAYVEGSPDIGAIIENSNDELAVTVTRAIATATASIVEAIEKQGSNNGITDTANVTSKVIQEINRIKRITGKSPINS